MLPVTGPVRFGLVRSGLRCSDYIYVSGFWALQTITWFLFLPPFTLYSLRVPGPMALGPWARIQRANRPKGPIGPWPGPIGPKGPLGSPGETPLGSHGPPLGPQKYYYYYYKIFFECLFLQWWCRHIQRTDSMPSTLLYFLSSVSVVHDILLIFLCTPKNALTSPFQRKMTGIGSINSIILKLQ